MRCGALIIGVCLLAGPSFAMGADEEIEGTVTSVNVDQSSLTVATKRDLEEIKRTLDILKKAKVTVNGQAGTLKDVRSGQKVSLVYNPDLDVVTRLDATGEGISEPEVAVLNELPPDSFHSAPCLSPDGLILYFVTFRPGEKQGWIWSARRKSKDDLFEDFKRLVPGNDPTVTGDGLELILNEGNALHVASRKSVDDAFSRPRKISELEGAGRIAAPSLSQDGLTLYADRWPREATDLNKAKIELVQFTRPTRTSKWGPAEAVKFSGLPAAYQGKMRFLSVTSDQLRAFTMQFGDGVQNNHVLTFSRKTKSGPFGNPAVVSVKGDRAFAQFPRYVESTHELFCMKPRADGKLDIVVIRNFDVDAATIPIREKP